MSIEDYEFEEDSFATIYECSNGNIEIDTGCDVVELTKRDAIAMSKHFKLTADDLNTD